MATSLKIKDWPAGAVLLEKKFPVKSLEEWEEGIIRDVALDLPPGAVIITVEVNVIVSLIKETKQVIILDPKADRVNKIQEHTVTEGM